MKKQFIAGLIITFMTSCSTTVYQNLWQSKPIEADGNSNEWSMPLRFYDKNSKLCYTVTNDSVNLYLCIRATDEQIQMKILRAGMQLWIDTTGKNKQQVGILFPYTSIGRNAPPPTEIMQGQKPGINAMMKKFISKYNEMQLIGFKPPIAGLIPLKNDYGISVGINMDSTNLLVFEAVVPFKTFYKQTLSASDSTKIFGITIIINAMQMPQMSRNTTSGDMQSGGNMKGGGGPPNGMQGGGGPPMQGSSDSPLTQVNTIKIKFKMKI
jgi:hypothetical protein